ncbi:WXG100 family type VII secretion target [Actinoplanes tereljensis]|uniref:ESAT-6-like protein n=1 Tax=Paractinoplanes tereljensis TaxID=571912 RepID=A0A919NWN6_9ACTN|nr:WXG100 family type VII secretion target [Actinoplanes tereljensis]GIF25620.1 hypothetical protein Ate02nite_83500 [Actinoplanes tereljensis]
MTEPLTTNYEANAAIMTAMEDAIQNCSDVGNAVESAATYLATHWSGEASNNYRNAVASWLQELAKVKSALEGLHSGTTDYHQRSQSVEQSNTQVASWI